MNTRRRFGASPTHMKGWRIRNMLISLFLKCSLVKTRALFGWDAHMQSHTPAGQAGIMSTSNLLLHHSHKPPNCRRQLFHTVTSHGRWWRLKCGWVRWSLGTISPCSFFSCVDCTCHLHIQIGLQMWTYAGARQQAAYAGAEEPSFQIGIQVTSLYWVRLLVLNTVLSTSLTAAIQR